MLKSLEEIFETNTIETNNSGERIVLHSNTSLEQGLFLQNIFDIIKPSRSLEVGFAYGISAMFILEKHRQYNGADAAHLAIEPDSYWDTAAMYNINKEGLSQYLQVFRDYSDKVLTQLFHDNCRIQYAYVDTTKQFDVVLQDFYFINKILDVGGAVILDDCGGGWPGVQRVARFINTLPNYSVLAAHNKIEYTAKKKIAQKLLSLIINSLPFKQKFYPTSDFRTDKELGLDFSCIAFQKTGEDTRGWNWDKSF